MKSYKLKSMALSFALVLTMLIGMVPGMSLTAYAAPTETLLTTITATAKEQASYSVENIATVSFSYTSGGSSAYLANWGWWGYGWIATVAPAEGYTITKCKFYDDANRDATDSEAPFVVETTEEDKTPKVNGIPILANTSKGIKKIEVYGYATPAHTHSFTYDADGATIIATCEGSGTCDITDGLTFTISAPTGNLVYDGTTTYPATLSTGYNTTAFPGTYSISYKKDGSAYSGVPKDAGTYTASVTAGTGDGAKTASVGYTIAKADSTANAPTGLTAIYGQTLADVSLEGKNPEGNTPGTWAWADSTKSVGNVVTPAATFKATFTPDSSNYKTVENVDVTVTVGKADPTAPTGLTATYGQTLASVTLPDGWTWADSTQSVGNVVDPAATFKANFAGDDNHNAASNFDVTVTVGKADQTAPTGLTATKASSSTATDGKISGVTSAMEYQIDGASAWTAVGENKTEITDLAAGTYKVRYAETANENASPEATIQVGVKEDQTAPTGLTATKASSSTAADGKISNVTDAMEYQKDGDTSWTAVGNGKTEITGLTAGTYKVRYAGTADKNASDATSVEVGTKTDQTAPTGLTATKASSSTAADGKISNVTDAMEYQKNDASAWTAVENNKTEITGLTSGTYKVRYKETADKNASPAASVEVGTKTDQTAPTGLTATKASSSTAADGKISNVTDAMEYQKNDASAWTAVENNKTEITGLTSGTYKVRYAGTANKNASPATSVVVGVKATQTITASDVTTIYGDTDKFVSASVTDPAEGSGAISYAVKSGSENYIDVNASTGALTIKAVPPTDGKAYVTVTAAETNDCLQATKDVTVTISKADSTPATVTANNRTYDSTEKPLVTVTGTATGGTMQYALGTDDQTAPTKDWNEAIPSKTDVGTYYVWYKAIGDANHSDSESAYVKVTIATKPAPTPAPADTTSIGSIHKVSGSNFAVTSAGTVSLVKAKSKKSLTVPATVTIDGKSFKVTGINAKAFKGTKVKTLTLKTKNLTKKSVKGSLKGSKVKTVKVKVGNKKTNKKYVKKYRKYFTKKNCGKKVRVTR